MGMVRTTIRGYILRHTRSKGTEAREWTVMENGDWDRAVGTARNEMRLRTEMERGSRNGNMYPKICAYSLGDPGRHVRHGSLGSPESITQTASRQFIRFCMARGCIQQTHTDHTPILTGRILCLA